MSAFVEVAPRVSSVLGRIELGRLLRHPAVILFGLATVALSVFAFIELATERTGYRYDLVANGPPFWVPLAVGVAIAAGLAATRSDREGVADLLASTPAGRATGSDPVLLAVLGTGGVALVLVLVLMTVFGGWNGLPVLLEPDRVGFVTYPVGTEVPVENVTPSLFELLAGPAALVVWACSAWLWPGCSACGS